MWETFLPHFLFIGNAVVSAQQRNAPKCRKSDKGVDDSANGRSLSAANPCNDVKGEKAYASPVDAADDGKDQRNAINNHVKNSFPPYILPSQSTNI